MIYNCPFINNLNYEFDSEFIEYMYEYNIKCIYYTINDSMKYPFIEILLDKLDFITIIPEPQYINQVNINTLKKYGETKNYKSRYQGYHIIDNNMYMYFRLKKDTSYNGNLLTLHDIVKKQYYYDDNISINVINYFISVYNKLNLYDIKNKKNIENTLEIYYCYIDSKYKDYILINKSMFYLNNKPIVNLDELKKIKTNDTFLVRNIVFDKKKIINYKQLMSFVEK